MSFSVSRVHEKNAVGLSKALPRCSMKLGMNFSGSCFLERFVLTLTKGIVGY